MMTPREFCAWANCSRASLDRLINEGKVRYVKLGSGRSAPIRLIDPETDLGISEPVSRRRHRRRRAQEEMRAVLAKIGGAA